MLACLSPEIDSLREGHQQVLALMRLGVDYDVAKADHSQPNISIHGRHLRS